MGNVVNGIETKIPFVIMSAGALPLGFAKMEGVPVEFIIKYPAWGAPGVPYFDADHFATIEQLPAFAVNEDGCRTGGLDRVISSVLIFIKPAM